MRVHSTGRPRCGPGPEQGRKPAQACMAVLGATLLLNRALFECCVALLDITECLFHENFTPEAHAWLASPGLLDQCLEQGNIPTSDQPSFHPKALSQSCGWCHSTHLATMTPGGHSPLRQCVSQCIGAANVSHALQSRLLTSS